MLNTRKSLYQQSRETDLAVAWARRIDAQLTLTDRNYGGLEDDKFDIADAHYWALLRRQSKD